MDKTVPLISVNMKHRVKIIVKCRFDVAKRLLIQSRYIRDINVQEELRHPANSAGGRSS